ncbi:hypothetical protein N7478_011335 [Penicillium angulare]|uniref:uncharacterized protein n=1 Tax=Penicillium angulare TaxID=116970 RepID=UPI0025402FF0|nr:uncharacterized protein N7478_011335 [Penicillium angulare]KAJ5263730.1 hypothetical protein N7478_011335 [Penicillium angulare]
METKPDIAQAVSNLRDALRNYRGKSTVNRSLSEALGDSGFDHSREPQDKHSRTPLLPPIGNDQLEKSVFTHPACGQSHNATYDRLEVLGDAYIELMATKLVWDKFPGIPAGRISQIREGLVKNETLAKFAETYGFDHRAKVPASYADQPKRLTKTKGDIFEAYVAAVILGDSHDGYRIANQWLVGLWSPMLDKLGQQKTQLRSKEELAKKVMGKGVKLEYITERDVVEERGSGTQTFFIGVYLTGWGWEKEHLGSGSGSSKAAAGDEAARNALINTSLISKINAVKKSTEQGR